MEHHFSRYLSRRSFLAKSGATLAALALGGRNLFAQGAASPWDTSMELAIQFEVLAPSSGRYKKPYVAVWFEDSLGFPVRTLVLWVQSGKGTRWVPDLKRWYRDESTRQQTYGGSLVSTISSPTRQAGKYAIAWDGLSDNGQMVSKGEYYVCVESAREHGPYHLIREKVTLGDIGFTQALQGGYELGAVSVDYRKRS